MQRQACPGEEDSLLFDTRDFMRDTKKTTDSQGVASPACPTGRKDRVAAAQQHQPPEQQATACRVLGEQQLKSRKRQAFRCTVTPAQQQ